MDDEPHFYFHRNSIIDSCVSLPAGTLLFRPVTEVKEDIRYLFRDILGEPTPGQGVFLSKEHSVNVSPFPFPFSDSLLQAVVLLHSVTIGEIMTLKKSDSITDEFMPWLYMDKDKQAGFPYFHISPFRNTNHKERTFSSTNKAFQWILEEDTLGNLNYLPLALFINDTTTIDIVNGIKHTMNKKTWMHEVMTIGISLPFYGISKLSFDTRTGFYVLPSLLPKNLSIPVPDAVLSFGSNEVHDIPYSNLLMPLDTEENQQLSMAYVLIFRTYNPEKLNTSFHLNEQVQVRRAMIFNRPAVLQKYVTGSTVDTSLARHLKRASEQWKGQKALKSPAQMTIEDSIVGEFSKQHFLGITKPFHSIFTETCFTIREPSEGRIVFSKSFADLNLIETNEEYKKALDKAFLMQDNETSQYHIFHTYEEYTAAHPDIRSKIDYYFSFLPKEKRFLIQTDSVALFSITAPTVADEQTNILLDIYKKLGFFTETTPIHITDATACVGGNTISFAKIGFVTAIEICPHRAFMLANNVSLTKNQKRVNVINGDYTQLYQFLPSDIVFLDPPWGGPDYKEKDSVDLFLGIVNIADFIGKIFNENTSVKLVAIKAPLNYNLKSLQTKIRNKQIFVVKQEKMQIILVANQTESTFTIKQYTNTKNIPRSFTRKHRQFQPCKTFKKNQNHVSTRILQYIDVFRRIWENHAFKKKESLG